jgi:hypothetical protein
VIETKTAILLFNQINSPTKELPASTEAKTAGSTA